MQPQDEAELVSETRGRRLPHRREPERWKAMGDGNAKREAYLEQASRRGLFRDLRRRAAALSSRLRSTP